MGRKAIDYTNKKFDKFTVLYRIGSCLDSKGKTHGCLWRCLCVCGNYFNANSNSLSRNKTRSCGCYDNIRTDLTNKRFGRLVVQYPVKIKGEPLRWHCKCDCGNEKDIVPNSLKRGLTKSCGCLQKNIVSNNFSKDLTGQRFGRLIAKDRIRDTKNDITKYTCECDCGNTCVVLHQCLITGATKSCGCLKSESSSERFSLKLEGKRFGRLTVVRRIRTVDTDFGKHALWECVCDCGKIKEVKSHDLVTRRVSSCGCMISKGEDLCNDILQEMQIYYKHQYSFKDLRTPKDRPYRFDFGLLNSDNSLIALIEYQGQQHSPDYKGKFIQSISPIIEGDKKKKEYCTENNIKLYEIWYYDDIETKMISILTELNLI